MAFIYLCFMMKVSLIVAKAENNAIGKDNDLIWKLPDDMRFFSETTKGHYVIMGRLNYDSIPLKYRPLPSRPNIVVTRNSEFVAEKCDIVDSVEKGWVFGWQKKGFKGKKNIDLWKRFLLIYPKHNVKFNWVKGHAGNVYNERCDTLAVEAAEGDNLLVDEGYEAVNKTNLFES